MPEQTVLVRYFGLVQGVGFRATCRSLAQRFPLRGWVKNEPDGSVSLIATGEAREVQAFLQSVRDSRVGQGIEREEVEPQAKVGDVKGFEIKH